MSDPAAHWTDEQVLEYARGLITERLEQALRAIERGCTIEEMLLDQGLPMQAMQVFEPDLRFIGHADFKARSGLVHRQYVYRDQRRPRKFYVLSLGTRTMLRQRGHALLLALIDDEKESN